MSIATATLPAVLSNGFAVPAIVKAVAEGNATQEQVLTAAIARRMKGELDSAGILGLLGGSAITQVGASTLIDVGKSSKGSCHTLPGGLSCKVSAKGAISVYGMGRWPVTLYQPQWVKLVGAVESVVAFGNDNSDKLATKES